MLLLLVIFENSEHNKYNKYENFEWKFKRTLNLLSLYTVSGILNFSCNLYVVIIYFIKIFYNHSKYYLGIISINFQQIFVFIMQKRNENKNLTNRSFKN
jgi:hypothetical protein